MASKLLEKAIQNLNKEQREAVETIEGPVMVVAGPGTGKTQILALRIANILEKTDATPENILCLTFTEAGVKAMRERLQRFIGNAAYNVSIHTFHSFANEVIQTFPQNFEFSKEATQLDDLKRLKIIQRIIEELWERKKDPSTVPDGRQTSSGQEYKKSKLVPFYNKYARQFDIISAIQTLKKEAIDPEVLLQKVEKMKANHEANVQMRAGKPTRAWENKKESIEALYEVYDIYKKYQEVLREEGFYDYEDMIMFVIKQFQKDQNLLANYWERYLYVLVDEYQDTNGSQNQIIKFLGSFDKSPNIFVVGDDDQAIYRFQGANLENILFFNKTFENVRIIPTPVNYRSTQVILDIAASLIEKNLNRLAAQSDARKELKANSKEEGQNGELWEFNNADEENIFLAKEIKRLHDEKKVKYSDIAILYRKNVHAEDVNDVLNKFEVPTKLESTRNLFEVESVKKLINLLKLINLYGKDIDSILYDVMLYDFIGLEVADVYRLVNYASMNKVSLAKVLIEEIMNEGAVTEPRFHNEDSIKTFAKNLLRWHQIQANTPLNRFLEIIITESGLLEHLTKQSTEGAIPQSYITSDPFEEILSVNSFVNYVNSQYTADRNLKLKDFIFDLKIVEENHIRVELQKVNAEIDAVNLMTAHSSKGLEFDYVFIIKATDSNWGKNKRNTSLLPKELYTDVDYDIDEKKLTLEDERRLFFVAITRAKKKVYFTYANEYPSNGNISFASPSQFLNEVDLKYVTKKSAVASEDKEPDMTFDANDYLNKLKPVSTVAPGEAEKEFLMEQISKFKMTPTALNVYLESPEDFKNRFLIRIPKIKTKEEALGTALHYVLEQINRGDNEGSVASPSLQTMLVNLEKSLKKEFFGDTDYEITLLEGKKILTDYYNNVLKNKEHVPAVEVEYNFFSHNVCLDSGDGTDPIMLSGRIDKIEWMNKDENTVKVIDYKNKTPISANQIKGLTQTSKGEIWRQLVFYKLLADLDNNFRPGRSRQQQKYRMTHAEVHFLKPSQSKKYKAEVFEITNQDVEELKKIVIEVMAKILNLEFTDNK